MVVTIITSMFWHTKIMTISECSGLRHNCYVHVLWNIQTTNNIEITPFTSWLLRWFSSKHKQMMTTSLIGVYQYLLQLTNTCSKGEHTGYFWDPGCELRMWRKYARSVYDNAYRAHRWAVFIIKRDISSYENDPCISARYCITSTYR